VHDHFRFLITMQTVRILFKKGLLMQFKRNLNVFSVLLKYRNYIFFFSKIYDYSNDVNSMAMIDILYLEIIARILIH